MARNSVAMSSPNEQNSSIQPGVDESTELSERIQSRPQELQDEIFNLTVAIEPAEAVISKSLKPPWQLSIDRASRQKVAQQYYSATTFAVEDFINPRVLQSWLSSLPIDHRHLILGIRLFFKGDFGSHLRAHGNVVSVSRLRIWLSLHGQNMKANFGLEESIFKTKMLESDSQGNERVLWLSHPEARELIG